jgi:hypothetical protein
MTESAETPAIVQRAWEEFNPPPMTLILPEDPALSNPPFVHWHGIPQAKYYRVRIVGRQYTHEQTVRLNFYTPPEEVPPGIYEVSVEALADAYAPLRHVARREVRIQFAGDPIVGPLNEIACPADTPLIASPDELERIRSAIGERAAYRDALLEAAEKADPLLGDGSLTEPARFPGGRWDFDLWHKGNSYCFAIENTVLACTLSYLISGKQPYAELAIHLMEQVAQWDPYGSTGVWENDHSAQALLHALALGYNALAPLMSESQRAAIERAIAFRCEDIYGLLNPFVPKDLSCGVMNNPENNHPWFVASAMGIGALALMGKHPKASQWVSFAAQLFHGNFLCRGGRSGAWHEGIDYWSYGLFFVFHFADALLNTTGINFYRHWWLARTAAFKAYTHPPVGAWVPFGDCKHRPPNAFDKLNAMRLASALRDPATWAYVDAIRAPITTTRYLFHAVLWSDRGDIPYPAPKPEMPFVQHYEDCGWVVNVANYYEEAKQVLFALHCGAGRTHGHADINSFVWCAGGDRLLWDAGYYDSYFSPHHRIYSRHSIAHNTVLVDGLGQAPHWSAQRGRITHFEADRTRLVVVGETNEELYYGRLAWFIRRFEYLDARELVVRNDIEARDPLRLSVLLHSMYPIHFENGTNSLRIVGKRYELRGVFETNEPIEIVLTNTFPVQPGLVSRVLDDPQEYPQQFHLELRTVNPVTRWKPVLRATIYPLS